METLRRDPAFLVPGQGYMGKLGHFPSSCFIRWVEIAYPLKPDRGISFLNREESEENDKNNIESH